MFIGPFNLAIISTIFFILLTPYLLNHRTTFNKESLKIFGYFIFIYTFLAINLIVALFNHVDLMIWISRSVFIVFIPLFYFIIKSLDLNFETRIKKSNEILYFVGLLELLFIIISAVNEGSISSGRATTLFNSVTYSSIILVSFYLVLEKFLKKQQIKYLFIIALFILCIILTGSRFLLLASLFYLLFKINNLKVILYLSIIIIIGYLIIGTNFLLFERSQNLEEDFSTLGKLGEIDVMINFFKSNPLFGKGIGIMYNNGVDLEDFTYTHNLIGFCLGYGGVFLLGIIFYPIIKCVIKFKLNFITFIFPIILFNISTTSYTGLKFSFLLSFLLVSLDSKVFPLAMK